VAPTLAIAIGIGNAQRFENLGFQSLHDKGLVVFQVIITQKMQESVHHQMGEMIGEALAEFRRLTLHRLARQHDVAEQAGDRRLRLELREGEDVRRLVDAAPLPVELLLFGIVGEDDGDLRRARDSGARPGKGGPDGGFGKRRKAIWPAVDIDRKLYTQRLGGGAQSALSPFSVAPS
jgi:hypothetical protein